MLDGERQSTRLVTGVIRNLDRAIPREDVEQLLRRIERLELLVTLPVHPKSSIQLCPAPPRAAGHTHVAERVEARPPGLPLGVRLGADAGRVWQGTHITRCCGNHVLPLLSTREGRVVFGDVGVVGGVVERGVHRTWGGGCDGGGLSSKALFQALLCPV